MENETQTRVKLKFNITDTGIGLNKDQQKILFQAFTQADTTTTRKFGGTGLGLVISKNIIESMNGKIGLDSQEKIGSTFWFTLDLEKNIDITTQQNLKFSGKKIIFHDANNLSQLASKYLLQKLGATVETSSDILQLNDSIGKLHALNKDLHLIIVGGYDQESNDLEKILNTSRMLDIPLLILINSNDEQVNRSHIELGYENTLSKPLTMNSMSRALDNIFNPNKQIQKNKMHDVQSTLQKKDITILCVDDNDANLSLLDAFVNDFDLKADFVDSGYKALEQCKLKEYDLIFMDIQMPGMDGIEATQSIRKINLHNSKVPIVALTAHAIIGERERIIAAGMDDFLTKPIAQDDLKVNIEKWTSVKVNYNVHKNTLPVTDNNASNKNSKKIKHKSIDWSLALKNANGKEDLAIKMLTMLIDSFPNAISSAEQYLKESSLDKLIAEIHKIQGATAYCGTPTLKEITNNYESELKLNGISKKAIKLHKLFIEETVKIKNQSKTYLN